MTERSTALPESPTALSLALFLTARLEAEEFDLELALTEAAAHFSLLPIDKALVNKVGTPFGINLRYRGPEFAAETLAHNLLKRETRVRTERRRRRNHGAPRDAQGRYISTTRAKRLKDGHVEFEPDHYGGPHPKPPGESELRRRRRVAKAKRRAVPGSAQTRALARDPRRYSRDASRRLRRMVRNPMDVLRWLTSLQRRDPVLAEQLRRAMYRTDNGKWRADTDPVAMNVFAVFILFTEVIGNGVPNRATQRTLVAGISRAQIAQLLTYNPRTDRPYSERTITRYIRALERDGLLFSFQPGPELLRIELEEKTLRVLNAEFPIGESGYAYNVYVTYSPQAVRAMVEAHSLSYEDWKPVFDRMQAEGSSRFQDSS